jgi:hypothetical protein
VENMTKYATLAVISFLAAHSVLAADSLSVNPSVIPEGGTVTISFTEGGNPNCFPGSSQSYILSFGDGTNPQFRSGKCGTDDSFSTTHRYADNNSSNTFRLSCGDATFLLRVTNVPPTVSAIANFYAMTGETISNWISFTDPGFDTAIASVNYGDGSPPQTIDLGFLKAFRLDHVYGATGTYPLSVTVTDEDGGADTKSAVVTVGNSPVAPATLDAYLFAGLVVQGTVGGTYDIQAESGLGTSNWTTIATLTLTNPAQLWIDPESTNSSRRFYRAVVKP